MDEFDIDVDELLDNVLGKNLVNYGVFSDIDYGSFLNENNENNIYITNNYLVKKVNEIVEAVGDYSKDYFATLSEKEKIDIIRMHIRPISAEAKEKLKNALFNLKYLSSSKHYLISKCIMLTYTDEELKKLIVKCDRNYEKLFGKINDILQDLILRNRSAGNFFKKVRKRMEYRKFTLQDRCKSKKIYTRKMLKNRIKTI